MHYTVAMSSSDDRPNSSDNAKGIKTFVIDTNVQITHFIPFWEMRVAERVASPYGFFRLYEELERE